VSQQAATITSLAMAFEIVKALQADGLELGPRAIVHRRRALAAVIEEH